MREGSLEAPTRHPLDWKSEAFYDEGKTLAEMERIFDICHGCRRRVNLCSQKTRELLETIPGTTLTTIERCSGHDGTWGVKKEYYDNSMKIGRPVFRQMAAAEPDWISSDCPTAARHIAEGIKKEQTAAAKAHPLTLLRKAYGI